MRIHVVGVARNPSTPNIAVDPYARASYWLTTLLYRRGIEVHYYGHEASTIESTQRYNIVDNDYHKKYFVTDFENSQWNDSNEAQNIFSQNAYNTLINSIQEGDIVVCMWSEQIPLLKQLSGVKVVDAHIGHLSFMGADYNIFTSTANQHFIYGKYNLNNCRWNDTVIPPICDSIEEFEYSEEKSDYILYLARLIEQKGIHIFLDIAKTYPNKKFIIAGQGDIATVTNALPSNVTYVGYAGLEKRKQLLSKAQAVISATYYIEPFGLTTIEANLSGTPVITTPWGGYVDNVVDGVTGFRCSSFSEFKEAVNNLHLINPKVCREFGEKFTAEVLIDRYIKYFNKINKNNWYAD